MQSMFFFFFVRIESFLLKSAQSTNFSEQQYAFTRNRVMDAVNREVGVLAEEEIGQDSNESYHPYLFGWFSPIRESYRDCTIVDFSSCKNKKLHLILRDVINAQTYPFLGKNTISYHGIILWQAIKHHNVYYCRS